MPWFRVLVRLLKGNFVVKGNFVAKENFVVGIPLKPSIFTLLDSPV